MEKKEDKNEHERLKLELRRLKRSNAPWYFESALHQRLHGGRPPRTRHSPYRVPVAVSLSLGVMALFALGSYFLLVNTNLFSRGPEGEQPVSVDSVRTGREAALPAIVPPVSAEIRSREGGSRETLQQTPVRVVAPPSVSPLEDDTTPAITDTLRRDTVRVRPATSASRRDSTVKAPAASPDTTTGGGGTP
jgi:hypothetical protein